MENILNYYYQLNIIDIKKKDYYYLLTTDEYEQYIFNEIIDSNELKENLDYLNNTNVLYDLLILTKEGNITINYNDKEYALFKVRNNENLNILSFSNLITTGKLKWGTLWSNRVDYYLEQIAEVVEQKEIKYAMDYYISLAEIAISYFNTLSEIYNENTLTFTLSHHIITSPIDKYMFYNPSNMCFDLSVRDIAEYIKESFFNDILTNYEILSLIDKINLNESLANYLLVRLIYPSYIFKLYDIFIETKELNKKFYEYMKKSREYETLLSTIYNKLKLDEYKDMVIKKQGRSMINEQLFKFIKENLKFKNVVDEENKEIPVIDEDKKEDKKDETIVKLNDVAVNCLVEQLKEKDKQIQELHRLIENSQILLKQEQKNCESQMQLEKHFKEVDKKLETLKAKMEDRREKKRFSFFKRKKQ